MVLIIILTGFQSELKKKSDSEKVQETIQAFFNGIGEFNYEAIRNVCTEHFIIFENGEKMSCEDFIDLLKQYQKMDASIKYRFENVNISVHGTHATVNLETFADAKIGGKEVKFHWLESAVLDKMGDEWKIAFYHSTEKAKPKPDPKSEKAAIEKCLDNLSKAYEMKDIELLSKIIAPGEELCIFGTDEEEKWTDHDSFVESQRRLFHNVEESRFMIKEQNIYPDPTATYARFYQIFDFEGVAEGKPYKITNTRMSGILEKQAWQWVMVQWHGSVPVSGQLVGY